MVDRLRRWWVRSGLITLAGVFALGFGWWLRQDDGGLVTEIYTFLAQPFTPEVQVPAQAATVQAADLQNHVAILEQENRQLRSLLALEATAGIGLIPARVIGRSSDHWWQEIVVNRGRLDGVAVGAAVVGIGGLVGQVNQVSDHGSRILLLSDPGSQVGVMFVRNRMMGILQGRRRERAIIECFEQQPLKKGDLVVTSGLSSRFPPGLPIGTVVHYDRSQASPRADISFSAPLGRLEYVKIYPEMPPEPVVPDPSPPDVSTPTDASLSRSSTP